MWVLPGEVAMVPNTAIGFILAGLALWWWAGVETRSRQLASRIAAAASGLLGFLVLAEYFSGLSFGIDELIFLDRAGLTGVFPGRMAVLAAVSFVAFGSALLLSNLRRARWAAAALAVIPGLLALISLVGYAYGVRSLTWIGKYKGMAIHTAAAFLILSLGVLLSRSDRGFARLMVSDTMGGMAARRIFPVALGVPLVLGWLRLVGQRAGLYGTEFGTALYAVSNSVVLLAIFWGIAAALMRIEQERKRAEEALEGSELRSRDLAAIVEFSDDAIIGKALDGTITTWNPGAERLYGWPSSEAIGQPVGFHIPPDRRDEMRVIMEKIRRGESVRRLETVRLRKKGDPIEVSLTVSSIRGTSGELVGASSIARDITERKRAEESLQKLQLAVEQAENVVFMTDSDGAITYVNPAFERVYGYTREEALGKTPRILKGGQHDRAYYERFWERLLAGESVTEELVNRRRDGQLVIMEASVSPVLDSRGGRIGFIAVQHDVTARKRSEEALRRSEQRFSLAFHASPIPTCISEVAAGRILDANEQFLRIFGYSIEEVIGKTSLELGIWADSADRDRAEDRIRNEKPIHNQVTRVRTRSGEVRDVVGSAVPIHLGSVKCVLWTFVDVTERRQAEEGMRKSEERFRRLFESNTIGITISDLSGHTFEANDAYLQMTGYTREELLAGRIRWTELTPAEHRASDQAAIEELRQFGTAPAWEKELLHKNGTRVPVLIGVAMLEASEGSCIAYIVDLTERRRLEQQFRQAQKMEAVGQLAGGVAHDFNNLLTAILGYSDMVAAKLDPGSLEFEELDEVRKAGERAASLTRQLLAFSRQQVLERKVLDVNDLIADVEKMLRRLIGEDIELKTALDPVLRSVFADAGQLEQVIMNLAVNARDAMPRGGKLTIETANVLLDEAYARQHVTVRPGSYVMIAVSDTGVGMNEGTLAHLFEPFFTTKVLGKGTGLGLATVYGIVKQSGGYIWAYSEIGKGTTFKIYLPLVDEGAEAEPVKVPDPALLAGSETVLLVEDEQSVRTLSRSILESYGYTVLEAASGKEGLDVVRQYPLPIHLLLTDVVMPEMGGPDLASRLEALRPGVRVLYMSGYTDDAVFRHGLLEKGRMFLQKPFTPGALAGKVREALGN
jgi:two-component system, cell cycle sensor histidine kinase and response regulator CckA